MPVWSQGSCSSGNRSVRQLISHPECPGRLRSWLQNKNPTERQWWPLQISCSLRAVTTYAPAASQCCERSGRDTSSPGEKLWTSTCIGGWWGEVVEHRAWSSLFGWDYQHAPKFCISIADAISDFSSFKFTHIFFCIKKKANKLFRKMFLIYLTHPTNFEPSKYIYIIRWAFLCNYHKILIPLTSSLKALLF